MINKVILIGHLGRDPEVRTTQSGTSVANFTVATNRRWTDRDGQRQEETEWHRIVVWARQAEIAGQYLRRGRQVYIEGRLQTRSWEDRQTGEKRWTTEVICENFQMLGSRGDAGGPPAAPEPYGPPSGYDGAPDYGSPSDSGGSGDSGQSGGDYAAQDDDDDIPF